MGTAGPLALARHILWNDQNIPFFVLNRWVQGRCRRGGGPLARCWSCRCVKGIFRNPSYAAVGR